MKIKLLSIQKLMVAVTATLALSACATVSHSSSEATSETRNEARVEVTEDNRENLMTQIKEHIGDASAETLNQCKLLAVGQRPCGGPEEYIAYSTMNTDVSALIRLASQYNSVSAAMAQEQGMYSTCEIMPEPPVQLSNGKCVIGTEATH